jgi:hypothetical protein
MGCDGAVDSVLCDPPKRQRYGRELEPNDCEDADSTEEDHISILLRVSLQMLDEVEMKEHVV